MLHSSVAYIGIGLIGAGISVNAIIVPFLECWWYERVGCEEYNHYDQADTNVEQRMSSMSRELLCLSLSPAWFVWHNIVAPSAGSSWWLRVYLFSFIVCFKEGSCCGHMIAVACCGDVGV